MNDPSLLLAYAVPLVGVLGVYLVRKRLRESRSAATLARAVKSGLMDPPTLHPVINPNLCVGAGGCTRACPEGTLGIVGGKAHLINPTVCIGHGACAAACPVEAISLVFGTARRGVDIPFVKPSFETNVDGLFIAGELGGMGLIRNAAEQGRQAIDAVARRPRAQGDMLDVVIVGAGPAGISATLAAMAQGLRFATIEQEDSLGGCVYHYPRNKIVATHPVTLALAGKVKLGEVSKESLLAFWQDIVDRFKVPLRFSERMDGIAAVEGGYRVRTSRGELLCRSVLLAIGRRGSPTKLGVPGEELPKVVYRLVDPDQYQGKRVLVVGGGNSAVEAALAVSDEPGAQAVLSYRGDAFARVTERNRERMDEAAAAGRLRVLLRSQVRLISADEVCVGTPEGLLTLPNDAVIVSVGGVLPTPMLKELGIRVETKFGTA